jgi:hypothetical protein
MNEPTTNALPIVLIHGLWMTAPHVSPGPSHIVDEPKVA